jgi:hypothetical protein
MRLARSRRLPRPIIISFLLLGLTVLGSPSLAARLTANNDTMVDVSRYRRAITIDVGVAFFSKTYGTADLARDVRDGGGVNWKT